MGLNRFGSAFRFFFHWGNNGVAPVIRDLGGLEGEVKNARKCWGYVGTQGFKGFGKEPIGWKVGVDPLSLRKKP